MTKKNGFKKNQSATGNPLCMLLTNCHGGRLCQVFRCSKPFMEDFELRYHRIDLHQVLEQKDLDRCQVFLYQHVGEKWGDMSTHRLLARLPKTCRTIRLPKLSSFLYWPYFIRPIAADPSWCKPCTEFPYFDRFLIECVAQGMDSERATQAYLGHDVVGEFDLEKRLADNINYLQTPLNCGEVNLNHLILNKLHREILFASPNHPSLILLAEEANLIFELLGYDRVNQTEAMDSLQEWEFFLPVHPGIIEHFSLKNITRETRYPTSGRNLTFEEYSLAYAQHYIDERRLAHSV